MHQLVFSWGESEQKPWHSSFVSSEKQEATQDTPTGGPSALEKAVWAPQLCHVMHRVFIEGPFSEDAMLTRIQYREWSRTLFDWGTAHGYPEHSIRIDGSVVSVIAQGLH